MNYPFSNRMHAGQCLAKKLERFARRHDVLVLALPRGGVPVAYEIAKYLEAQLDLLLVRKLGIPGNEELAMGAVSRDGVCVLRHEIISALDIPAEVIEAAAQRELREMAKRERHLRSGRPPPSVAGRTVIVVDDGLATGATMQAAVRSLKHEHPMQIIAAIPVAARDSILELQHEVDDVVCLSKPEWFGAVGTFYEDFSQVSDSEVRELLTQAEQWYIPDDHYPSYVSSRKSSRGESGRHPEH